MNKFLRFLLLALLLFISFIHFTQSISPDELRNLDVNNLSNDKVKDIKLKLEKENKSISDLESMAIGSGMTAANFQILKTRIETIDPVVLESNVDQGVVIEEQPIEMDKNSGIAISDVFGSEIFNNTALNFEPNPNLIAPSSYVIGPGDDFSIIIYGMQEFSTNVSVNKEGRIYIPIVGQLYLNGMTLGAAKLQIKKACSKIYSSLNSGQSNISISLGKIRSIRITILGCKNPGNYLVSSLATVFNALHVAGGPNGNGSYRNIELIRNNKVIKKIDIYKYLMSGDQSDNVNLEDEDIIRIPIYENRVQIGGHVKRPGIFELLPNETFEDLLRYCSGFTESAYKSNIKLIQNTDKELKITDLSENDYKTYKPKLGDILKVSTILNRFENKITIRGSVFRPDDYALTEGMTLLDLINKADGLTEDAYKNRAILIRQKEDLTKEMIHVDLAAIMNGSKSIKLEKNDEIAVNSIFDFLGQKIVSIDGEVRKPGDFPFVENLTLYDVILQAGGFTLGSSKTVEIASVIFKDEKTNEIIERSIVKSYEIDSTLRDLTKNIKLSPFDVISIRKKPIFETQMKILVKGEVIYPGNYVITNTNERVLDFINRAGGIMLSANINAIYIFRKIDNVATLRADGSTVKIPIDFKYINKHPKSNKNLLIKPGDEIIIERIDNTVKVAGFVRFDTEIPYVKGKRLKYYIKAAGGFKDDASKKGIYLVNANGFGDRTKHFWFFKDYPKINLGCQIHVPQKYVEVDNNRLTITELSVITGVLGSLATMVVAIVTLTK
jgi:protein involved in polysaccharide export with SLBB domain